jgi:hypothetical protein
MMCQAKIQEATVSVSQNQEPIAKMLRSLDEGQAQKNGKLVSRWVRDENSKLYCQWVFE